MKSKSKLPFDLIDSIRNDILDNAIEDQGEHNGEKFAFLEALKGVYIECFRCKRMIAPDEIYEIVREEAVCEECFADEN